MKPDERHLEVIPSDTEPGMNLISVDFDLVMVNRTNERLYGKPIVALLGKKCYREFEKRDEPCPHCPGRLALATGEAHETETMGLRDDGTRFFARIRAHPVAGPHGQPTGFIEVVEDITENKRSQSLAVLHTGLRAALLATHSLRKALRETFEAALRVECIDMGCVFSVDQVTGENHLVFERNVPSSCLKPLLSISQGASVSALAEAAEAPKAVEVVPILHASNPVATLIVGTFTYPDIPPTLRGGLQSLGAAAGHTVSRIRAEQSRGDAVADLEALIASNPTPTWVLDAERRVTMWNKAAERLFGWKATEITGRRSPFALDTEEDHTGEPLPTNPYIAVLVGKDGSAVEVRIASTPFRDVVGDASTVILMAEDLTAQRRLADLEARLATLVNLPDETPSPGATPSVGDLPAGGSLRALLIDPTGSWGQELADMLGEQGFVTVTCSSAEDAAAFITETEGQGHPFALAVVDLVAPARSGGPGQIVILRNLGLKAPVIVSSDADVRGHLQHGIAAVIKRPHDPEAVARVIQGALLPHE